MNSSNKQAVKEMLAIIEMTLKSIRKDTQKMSNYVAEGKTLEALVEDQNLKIKYRLLEGYIAMYKKYANEK